MDSLPHKIELCKPPNPLLDFPHSPGSPEMPVWGLLAAGHWLLRLLSPQVQNLHLCSSYITTFIIPSSSIILPEHAGRTLAIIAFPQHTLPVLIEAFSNFCVIQNLGLVAIHQSPSSKSMSYHFYNPQSLTIPPNGLTGRHWIRQCHHHQKWTSSGLCPTRSCYFLLIHKRLWRVQKTWHLVLPIEEEVLRIRDGTSNLKRILGTFPSLCFPVCKSE